MREENNTDNQFFAKMVILNYLLLPLYMILQLKIEIKAHFIIPILYIIMLIKNKKKIKNNNIFLYVFLFFIIQIPYSIFQYYNYLYNWLGLMYLLFFCSLPWIIVGCSLTNLEEILIQFKKKNIYIIISNIVLILFCKYTGRTMLGNMEISYTILPLVLFSLLIFFNEKKYKFLIACFLGTMIIVIVGSRGPILCIALFILLYGMFNFKKKIIYIVLIGIILLFTFFYYKSILNTTINIFEHYGISSRTLYKLQNGDILNDTGRKKIQKVVMEELNKHPIVGLSLGGERIIVNNNIYHMNKNMSSCYPHNIIIEILAQYGYFTGIIIIIFLNYIIIKVLMITKGNERNIILLLISQELVKLFISSSYMLSPMFFLLLGVCLNKLRRK